MRDDEDRKEFIKAAKKDESKTIIYASLFILGLAVAADLIAENPAPFQVGRMTLAYLLGGGGLVYGLWTRFM